MEISASNNAAIGVEIQGLPDGTIEIVGVPLPSKNTTVRARIMSKRRKAIISRAVALRVLEGLIKNNDVDYDMNLLEDDDGVEAEGTIDFLPPKPGVFREMSMFIHFGVPHEDVLSFIQVQQRTAVDVVSIQEQLESERMEDNTDETEKRLGVSSASLADDAVEIEGKKLVALEKSLGYEIEINFQEFLIGMVSAL